MIFKSFTNIITVIFKSKIKINRSTYNNTCSVLFFIQFNSYQS